MKHWFKDQHFRSLLKNSSYLGMSRIVAAIAGIATLAMAGRGLGVVMFGTLILIHSYAKAASGLSKFESWQLIVRYGGQSLAEGHTDEFKTSTGFAPGGATHDDLRLMRANVSPHIGVKAAGGVRTLDALLEVMALGTTRIGATATKAIIDEFRARKAGRAATTVAAGSVGDGAAGGSY